MAEARRVIPDIDFNGKSAKKSLDGLMIFRCPKRIMGMER